MITIIASDAGRSKSRRTNQFNDCVIRAVAIAYNQQYDYVFDLFKVVVKGDLSDGIKDCNTLKVLKLLDPTVICFDPVYNTSLFTVARFISEFKQGTYILSISDHMSVVIDGVLFDIDMAPKRLLKEEIITVFKKSQS